MQINLLTIGGAQGAPVSYMGVIEAVDVLTNWLTGFNRFLYDREIIKTKRITTTPAGKKNQYFKETQLISCCYGLVLNPVQF